MIDIQNCTATKAGRKLFQNLSFSIKEGEHWLIHGKNGSGKTALLELIAGHLNIVSGRISYSFITSTDWDVRHRQLRSAVRYIPAHSMHHLLTGEHELFYQQRYYSMGNERFPRVRDLFSSEPETKVLSTFPESLKISNLLDLELIRLSNGQLKKVLILQHLLKQTPRFLLLDY